MFLPLSQCSIQTSSKVDENANQEIKSSTSVKKDIVVVNSILGEEAELSFEGFLLPIAFLIPLIFSLLPNFSLWKKAVKLAAQIVFSVWFVYNSYTLVFSIGSPLIAGYLLMFASCAFLILCFIEIVAMKHNKTKNENASKVGTDAQNDARSF